VSAERWFADTRGAGVERPLSALRTPGSPRPLDHGMCDTVGAGDLAAFAGQPCLSRMAGAFAPVVIFEPDDVVKVGG
jgi:hypothetical protein